MPSPALPTLSLRVADGGRRSASAAAVLRAVLEDGPIARSTVARITGLSPASVTGHCNELTELGLLRELPDQVRSNGAGRPHIPVDIDVTRHVAAAVHIAVRLTTTALLDLRGRVIARQQAPHDATDPATIVDRAARSIAELYAAHGGDARLLGVGVATGGWVDPESGVVMDHPRLGWSLVPLRDQLSERTGLPVHVDGHSRALLHAEVLFGEASRVGSVLHVFVGNVVDAAFATRGEAHHGSRAQAGAIAHFPVEGSREPCACGRLGCLEATVSEQTLTRRAHEQGIVDTPDIRTLFEAARDGNEAAVGLFVDRSRLVGRAVALLMDVFGPERVVVTDPTLPYLPRALNALRTAARENVRTVCDVDSVLMPTSFPGRVLETAGGAVLLDALYRNPLGTINSEDLNVDIAGRFR
ncbi:ROK family transcriptional regulator [Actinospica sp.]|uniref:ROK family transcriptional regulator n=1 Tax=Actinospica sp. TaxID=1872142 RepID=UPI002C7FD3B2|nr:ROK family transcriptional regulator [Actinospica sp.]HWG24778.1 ROK family transcriptional regulator [Actinospica sp.]